jgi:hypothetical protein
MVVKQIVDKLEIVHSMFNEQDCFASLPAGYMDNARFVSRNRENSLVFQLLKLEIASLSKLRKFANNCLFDM